MLIKKLEKTIAGAPIKVGKSKGGMSAFMVGTCYVTFKGQWYERPVVFLEQNQNPNVPGLDQLMTVDQLIKFSQPKSWEFDVAAIAQAEQQLKGVPSQEAMDGESKLDAKATSPSRSQTNPESEERSVVH